MPIIHTLYVPFVGLIFVVSRLSTKTGPLENFLLYSMCLGFFIPYTTKISLDKRFAKGSYHSVPGKRPWALKHNSRFWPTWCQDINCCVEAATLTAVHRCLPGSERLPRTPQYMCFVLGQKFNFTSSSHYPSGSSGWS